jgi:aminoglycoside phosphotransferase (APT) family kinase protein
VTTTIRQPVDAARLSVLLRKVVEEALAEDVAIDALEQLTGGASRQTWSFDAVTAAGERRPLILRRDAPDAPRGGMSVEARAIAAARRAGVPGPAIIAFADDTVALDAPFIVMERVEGETLARRILRDDAYADVRPRLAEQCGEILARIHGIPPDEVPGLERPDVLADVRDTIRSYDDASPALELGLRWLEEHRPPPEDEVVVHGDFRNGNLIVGPDGVRAVLDWELVHRGAPMQDLGYLCVRAWRFGVSRPVGGFGDYEQLFRGYERVSGRRVDREAVRWWQVFGTVWWGGACMDQAWRHLSGDERSVELAAIGRRVWEQEYDVLLLLDGAQGGA